MQRRSEVRGSGPRTSHLGQRAAPGISQAGLRSIRWVTERLAWGPAHHDGMTIEYTYGMEEFDKDTPRDARQLVPSLETVDMWGGTPEGEFGKRGLIEELAV